MSFSRHFLTVLTPLITLLPWSVPNLDSSLYAAPQEKPTKIVLLIGEREYNTQETLARFANEILKIQGFECVVVHADESDKNSFPGIETIVDADLLVVSVRRRTLPTTQLKFVRDHLAAGKPLIGIRTASHAFSLRSGQPAPQHDQWLDFDAAVLGGNYQGHFSNKSGTEITIDSKKASHPILTGVEKKTFRSGGTLYKNPKLGPKAVNLLTGSITVDGKKESMPVAWTNQFGKSRIFYTSLGQEEEFSDPSFIRILNNAVYWCLNQEVKQVDLPDSNTQTSPQDRNVFREGVTANEAVEKMMRSFEGRGTTGDTSLPTDPMKATSLFNVADGLEMKLVASEPEVMQPLFMSWDARGRMWVIQYLQYPFPEGLKVVSYDQHLRAVFDKVPPPPPNHFVGKDKITVFEDTNGDGHYDSSKDVITGLNIATSVVTGQGGIWVLNPPYLLFYPDADGDDVPDSDPEVRLSGFGLEDTHSVANSLKWGPDGWLYAANGSTTTATINSANTRNVHFKGQCIWRYHPDTQIFEVYAEGGGNTFSVEIDGKGTVFSGTNNGNTRGMHYPQGGYAKKNWGKHGPLTNPFALGHFEHMRHKGMTERFSQAFSIYEGGSLPDKYNNMVISANSLHNQVLASELFRDTSSYQTTDIPPIVTTPDHWFRPVDIKVGPDGGVYLADWYDSRLTHVDPRDNWHKSSGRIFRLQSTEAQPIGKFDLTKSTSDELIDFFGHQNKWFRHTAVRVLGERKDLKVAPKLKSIAQDPNDIRSLQALWTLNQYGMFDADLAASLMVHRDPNLRRWTVRLLGDQRVISDDLAGQLASLAESEPDVQVRSQLASSAKRLPASQGLAITKNLLARSEDASDLHVPLLLWWAIEDKMISDREQVLEMFQDAAFWKLPIVKSTVLKRVMQRFALAGKQEDLEACAKLLSIAPSSEERDELMAGLMAAFQGRKMEGLPESLSKAIVEYQKSLGQSDIALALRLGDEKAIATALQIATSANADPAERLNYIEILGQINQPKVVPTLLRNISRSGDYDAKRVTLQALMNYPDDSIGRTLIGRYNSTLPDELNVRSTAQRVLASRKSWSLMFLHEIDQWRIKSQTIPLDVVQQMSMHNDDEIDRLIEKLWGKLGDRTPEEKLHRMTFIGDLVKSGQGDLGAGKKLFTEHCGKCHTLYAEGGKAGPDLTGYERTNLDFLLMAIVDPSAAIREEYTTFLVQTNDGRTLTGLIDEQNTRTVTLRGVDGQPTLINQDDIDQLKAIPKSLMPDDLLKEYTDAQVRDLFTYLMSRAPLKTVAK